ARRPEMWLSPPDGRSVTGTRGPVPPGCGGRGCESPPGPHSAAGRRPWRRSPAGYWCLRDLPPTPGSSCFLSDTLPEDQHPENEQGEAGGHQAPVAHRLQHKELQVGKVEVQDERDRGRDEHQRSRLRQQRPLQQRGQCHQTKVEDSQGTVGDAEEPAIFAAHHRAAARAEADDGAVGHMRVPHVRADRYPCQSEPDDRYHPISAYSPCGTIPRRQGWPAKARNIRAFAMAIIEVLPRRLRERIEQLGAIGRDPAGGLTRLPFADEEGHAFGVGTMSSRALVGELGRSRLAQLRDGTGRSVDEYLRARAHGLPAARVPAEVDAYVELHIEQGPVLEQMGRTVAAVV